MDHGRRLRFSPKCARPPTRICSLDLMQCSMSGGRWPAFGVLPIRSRESDKPIGNKGITDRAGTG